jgi:pyruvate dehydrogenase E1 component
MTNLGGHDMASIIEAFDAIDHDRPTCFIAYTIKGFGLPLAGHKDNHAGLMTPAQMETFKAAQNVRPATNGTCSKAWRAPRALRRRSSPTCRSPRRRRRLKAPGARRAGGSLAARPKMSTQRASADAQRARARRHGARRRIVTTSPDVTVSTNLGAWVNRRGLFAAREHGRHLPRASAFPRPSTGNSRRRASISSSASPR